MVPLEQPVATERTESDGSQATERRLSTIGASQFVSERERRKSSVLTRSASALFMDADLMKEKIRQSIAKPVYNVYDYYHTTGPWQRVARSSVFEQITLTVISVNAVWIAIDADWNKNQTLLDAHPVFLVVENLFCAFFTFEWLVRFMAFQKKLSSMKDSWFVFDTVLVCMTIVETWVMIAVTAVVFAVTKPGDKSGFGGTSDTSILRLIRLLRLSRMARMAKIFRAIPELMIMMKGLVAAIRSVIVTLSMLTLIIYIFGIAFTQLMSETGTGDLYFNGVLDSMNTLLLYGVFLDQVADVFNALGSENAAFSIVFLLFVLIAAFLVVNMLIGVMVETVHVVSMVEREQMTVNFTKDKLLNMLHTSNIDANNDQLISKTEFGALLQIPAAVRALQELGVDVVALVDHSEFVFESGSHLEFPAFMEMVLQLRGSNKATVRDIVDLRKYMRQEIAKLRTLLQESSPIRRLGAVTNSWSVEPLA
mmetsp:Transcript_84138/g.261701  ORF Transcript_84138/g.261701 Transcript_84138/m.261701 type:complete len:480 (-) Transcript_84138:50-1489(-)